jgi:hypothetical protein
LPLFAGGGVGKNGNLAANAAALIMLGASGVQIGKYIMQAAAGCLGSETDRCNICNIGLCPKGITSQDPRLYRRLDVDQVAERVVDAFLSFDTELKKSWRRWAVPRHCPSACPMPWASAMKMPPSGWILNMWCSACLRGGERLMSSDQDYIVIPGKIDGQRVESRLLEERVQSAVAQGHTRLKIEAYGQHGIGGRLWKAGDTKIHVQVIGPIGQRAGSLGFPNTGLTSMARLRTTWAGSMPGRNRRCTATRPTACQRHGPGQIFVAGNIGARGMTMTKHNPRFEPPELWVLGSAGDYFAEFMAGGIAVICGHAPQNRTMCLGYRPMVGMVGGKVLFRGPARGQPRRCQNDAHR